MAEWEEAEWEDAAEEGEEGAEGEMLTIEVQATSGEGKASRKRVGGGGGGGEALDNSMLSELLKKKKPRTSKGANKGSATGKALRYDNKTALERHRIGLVKSLHALQRLSATINESSLCAWVLSVFPDKFTDEKFYQPFVSPSHLQQLLQWAGQHFAPKDFHRDEANADDDGLFDDAQLAQRISSTTKLDDQYHLTCKEICVVMTALMRLVGVKTRIVRTVDPPSWKGKDHSDLCEQAVREFHRTKVSTGASAKLDEDAINTHQIKGKTRPASRYWLEIWQIKCTGVAAPAAAAAAVASEPLVISLDDSVPTTAPLRALQVIDGAWIHCDPLVNRINSPGVVVEELRRSRNVEYCVACDEEGRVADVTTRYEKSSESTLRARCPTIQSWWSDQLEDRNRLLLSAPPSSADATSLPSRGNAVTPSSWSSGASERSGGSAGSSASVSAESAALHKKEEEEFLRKRYNAPLPKTLEAFKDHLLFVVEDCEEAPLKTHECINPHKTKGNLKGFVASKRVYPRFVVEECKSRMAWRKVLRLVAPDALPCKTFIKKNREGEPYSSELFGSWQTTELVLEKVSDKGEIPTNSFGNVEVWDGCETLVPPGARFVAISPNQTIEMMRKTASALKLPFKDAITGFESRGGLRHAKIGGLVVLQDHFDVLRDALSQVKQIKEQEQDHKREMEIVKRWEALVRSALSRQALKRMYGH